MSSWRPPFGVVVSAVEVGVALVVFQVARAAGAGDVGAYLLSTAGPLLGAVLVWRRARALNGASVAILCFALLSAVTALIGGHDASVLLYKDAGVTGAIGLLFAASLLLSRPLAFHFGQRFWTDGSAAGMRAWSALWSAPEFRRANRLVTVVWAVVLLGQAVAQGVVVHHTDVGTAFLWTQLLPWVATGIAVAGTLAIGRWCTSRLEATAVS
ncbi:MAG: VC0807 family protein [Jatrophihabitans sp.]|uniref:VC0807 family protein n=1 Tax=Jatrophihabitans sp. TaxID=1932789 RepID=UPI003F80438A